jgi:predicted dehydrogenase
MKSDSPVSALPVRAPVKVALLGAGVIADPHAHALKQLTGTTDLAAVCDRDIAKAKAFQQKWSIPAVYESAQALLEAVRPDVVHVLLPPAAHADAAIECIEGGCHVLVEKPFCLSAAECRRVMDAAAAHNRRVGVSHNLTFMPSLLRMVDEIRSCRIGAVQHINVTYSLPLRPVLVSGPHSHWMFGSPERIMLELGPHPLSVIYRLMGPTVSAATALAGKRTLSNGQTFYSSWLTSLVCERGSAQCALMLGGEYLNTWVHVVGQDGEILADLRRNTVRISEKGRYPRTDNLRDAWRNGTGVIRQSLRNFKAQTGAMLGFGPAYDMQTMSMNASVKAFYDALIAGRQLPVDGLDGMAVVQSCEAVVDSARVFVEATEVEQSVAAR